MKFVNVFSLKSFPLYGIFVAGCQTIHENCEILHYVKIFRYTVCVRENQNSWNALANDVMALNRKTQVC